MTDISLEEIVCAPRKCDICGLVSTRFRKYGGTDSDGEKLEVFFCLKCTEDSDLELADLFGKLKK